MHVARGRVSRQGAQPAAHRLGALAFGLEQALPLAQRHRITVAPGPGPPDGGHEQWCVSLDGEERRTGRQRSRCTEEWQLDAATGQVPVSDQPDRLEVSRQASNPTPFPTRPARRRP